MVHARLIVLLFLAYNNGVSSIPHLEKRSLANVKHESQTIIKHETEKVIPIVPVHNVLVPINSRKPKGPISISHQLLVPNLHVIPITNVHQIHTSVNHGNDVTSNAVSHSTNVTHSTQYLPVLFPIHHIAPVHDLTVIPLHSVVHKNSISYKLTNNNNDGEESINRYRNPIGGYGAGWYYGGHGAGHGFHYSYG